MKKQSKIFLIIALIVLGLLAFGFLTFGVEQVSLNVEGFESFEDAIDVNIPNKENLRELDNTAIDWEMTTLTGEDSYLFYTFPGQEKTKVLKFENFEGFPQIVNLNCVDEEGELCQYITFEENPVELPLSRSIPTYNDFVLRTPLDAKVGTYSFTIVAGDKSGEYSLIPVIVEVRIGFFSSIMSKITSNLILFQEGGSSLKIHYLIIFFFFWTLLTILSLQFFFKEVKNKVVFSMLISFILSFILLGFI